MAILTQKLRSGHRGGLIYQPLPDGRQMVRRMPSHYTTSYHPVLVESREKFKNLAMVHRILGECIHGCFAIGNRKSSIYNRFMRCNLASSKGRITAEMYSEGKSAIENYMVSEGDLTPLIYSVEKEGNETFLSLKLDCRQWHKGDVLRFIALEPREASDSFESPLLLKARFKDMVIDSPASQVMRSEALSRGAYAFVHLRKVEGIDKDALNGGLDTKGGYRASSQRLVVVDDLNSRE